MSRNQRSRKNKLVVDQETYQRLCRARAFIDSYYGHPLRLEQISRQACFSRYHFLRLFRQAFNKTPHQYLTQKRIERAKELLVLSDLTVTDVCFEVGFESLGSFSSLFRKYVGHPPNAYRSRQTRPIEVYQHNHPAPIPSCFLMRFGMISAGA